MAGVWDGIGLVGGREPLPGGGSAAGGVSDRDPVSPERRELQETGSGRRLANPASRTRSGAEVLPPAGAAATGTEEASGDPGSSARSRAQGSGVASATDNWLLLAGTPGESGLATAARQRLRLLCDASVRIGTTLSVTTTAAELAGVAVPRFADVVTVDLLDTVLDGEEPIVASVRRLRRAALVARCRRDSFHPVGDAVVFPQSAPQARSLVNALSLLESALGVTTPWLTEDPAWRAEVIRQSIHSLITVPLRARGCVLGVASFYRVEQPNAFEGDDVSLAEELAARAAICIDNARRFTREHTMALALQRSLLPRGLPKQNAVEVAQRYLPAHGRVGGDWFDVIPLSGARVALVVGDVVGHGLHAAATMGRLRTAVQNFSALDLPPDELLSHLDDLVNRLDQDAAAGGGFGVGVIGATCLYAVYDPVSQRCTLTRAGHPPPAVVRPDGAAFFPDLPAGPPLGLGGLPFETAEIDLPEGSQLVLYTDGLIESPGRDIDLGIERLRDVLSDPHRTPEQTCNAVLEALLPSHPHDDVALLVARPRMLGPRQVACWELPAEPAVVSPMRLAVTSQLAEWDLEEFAFATELIASELVTNAIRHASGPVQVRLLRDRALIFEVADGSSTSPRLRRASTTDEGGRGLFLVAQLAQRWGTRYTATGKVIWTEQPLPGRLPPPVVSGGRPARRGGPMAFL